MPARPSWRNLFPGLAAIAAVLLVALGVLLFAGVGKMRGKKTHLYVAASQAHNVLAGTEVWIAGQKVGTVDGIMFAPPSADSTSRVIIAISVLAHDASQIRRDSRAEIRAGANIIGPIVIALDAGTPGSPPAREGDTLRSAAPADFESAGVRLSAATSQLPTIMADARTVIGYVRKGNGTVGAALRGGQGPAITQLRARVSSVRTAFSGGAKANLNGVMDRAHEALARVDSIRTLLKSGNTSLGRFRRDSTLGSSVAGIRDELSRLQEQLDVSDGTLGRLKSDSALSTAVTDARREMTSLFTDIRKRPFRYLSF